MAAFKMNCPWCEQKIEVDDEWLGLAVECPVCQKEFIVRKNDSAAMPQLKIVKNDRNNSAKSFQKPKITLDKKIGVVSGVVFGLILGFILGFVVSALLLPGQNEEVTNDNSTGEVQIAKEPAVAKKETAAKKRKTVSNEFERGEKLYSEKNYKEAVECFRKAAENGDARAQYKLGLCYSALEIYYEAVDWFTKAAAKGMTEAEYELGMCYLNGNGVPKSEVKAGQYFKPAANKGYAPAQYQYGFIYHTHNFKWWKKAADQGYAPAQYTVGWCYDNGKNIHQDKNEAIRWYKKSAEQGVIDAQYRLGMAYCYKNAYKDAVKWFSVAAEKGHIDSIYELAKCYEHGRGVKQSISEAAKLHQKAAKLGDMTSSLLSRIWLEQRNIPY